MCQVVDPKPVPWSSRLPMLYLFGGSKDLYPPGPQGERPQEGKRSVSFRFQLFPFRSETFRSVSGRSVSLRNVSLRFAPFRFGWFRFVPFRAVPFPYLSVSFRCQNNVSCVSFRFGPSSAMGAPWGPWGSHGEAMCAHRGPWGSHGAPMGRPWGPGGSLQGPWGSMASHGEPLESSCGAHGWQPMGSLWGPMEVHARSMGIPWGFQVGPMAIP